jgi:hypothetical protein
MCDNPLLDMTLLSQQYDINYIAPMSEPIQLELLKKYVFKNPPTDINIPPIDLNE